MPFLRNGWGRVKMRGRGNSGADGSREVFLRSFAKNVRMPKGPPVTTNLTTLHHLALKSTKDAVLPI
jgi:hypothetical protein